MATKKINSHAEKFECIQRIALHNSPVNICAKRYNVTQGTIKKWVRQFKNGELLKRHSKWSQHWDKPSVIHHFVDIDVLNSIKRGKPTYEDSIISLFDPELDSINGLAHLEWTDHDIDKLCLWMIDRSLEIIRDVGLSTDDFKEEMNFIESSFFAMICKAYGYDADEIRKGVYRAVAARAAAEDRKEDEASNTTTQRLELKSLEVTSATDLTLVNA